MLMRDSLKGQIKSVYSLPGMTGEIVSEHGRKVGRTVCIFMYFTYVNYAVYLQPF